nr:rRNA maturation RNase YbeY [uncultured Campylobacter sp.]
MILCEQPYPEILDAIAAELGGGSVELIFVRGEEMRQLNAQTRGIDKATDVLSFPLDPAAFAGFGGDLSKENSAHKNSGSKNQNAANSASENTGVANSASENTSAANSASENSNTINSKNSEGESPNDKNLKNENFDGGNFAHALLGSVVINLDLVELKAAQLGHGRDDETALLFTHGLLHVLGYDHESDDGQMRAKECEIIEKFRLPKSLIVRTERNEE